MAEKKFYLVNIFILALFLLDRFFKFYFFSYPSAQWDFIFSWRLSKNFGIAFNLPVPLPVIILATIIIFIILISLYLTFFKAGNFFYTFSFALIIAGAFSNLLDRLYHRFVVDYIDVPYFTVLNLADLMISTGVAMIFFKEIFFKNYNKR